MSIAERKMAKYEDYKKSAVFFSGGGARGAYQVGVALATYELIKNKKHLFGMFSGFSAGAINASFLAQHASTQRRACEKLADFWRAVRFEDIYKTDSYALTKNSLKWISDLSLGSLKKQKSASSLLDSSPLLTLINTKLNPLMIERQVEKGFLTALCCHSYNYNIDKSIVFFQGSDSISQWNLEKRESRKVKISAEHVYASCSIPLVFPPVRIQNEVYADGAVRNTAPLSAAIHSGANKIFVVGVENSMRPQGDFQPTVGAIISTMLKALFFDALDSDITRLEYLNQTLKENSKNNATENRFKPVPYIYIKPSEEIKNISKNYFNRFPRPIRFLLEGLGSEDDIGELSSYLLFEKDYVKDLIDLGINDVQQMKNEIIDFFEPTPT